MSITIPRRLEARLKKIAAVVSTNPPEVVAIEALELYCEMVDSSGLAEMETTRQIYDTLAEVKRAARRTSKFDNHNYKWLFYKTADGRFCVEYDPRFHDERMEQGCVLVH